MTNPGESAVDKFGIRGTMETAAGPVSVYRLPALEAQGIGKIARLPYSIRVLLESAARHCDGYAVSPEDVRNLAAWSAQPSTPVEIPFHPARVVLQDFTGVPAVVDLAAMRSAMQRLGGDPRRVNPLIPADLVIDHSLQVDRFGHRDALRRNIDLEFERNRERYEFLRWGQEAFDNFRVIPPGVGIVHQVNLEMLAQCVICREDGRGPVAVPDTLVGTDSHTTMINGLGIVGWGVGGIEAEAVMLGQPIRMLMPEVVGFELTGAVAPGVTATDVVLTITQILRREGVVGKFVEFFGEGVDAMSLPDRATIANMAPEYGATMGFFPTDAETLGYLRRTGRSAAHVDLVERFAKEQLLFRAAQSPTPEFTKLLTFDLASVEPCLAGPKRPQDRVALTAVAHSFRESLRAPIQARGFALSDEGLHASVPVDDSEPPIGHGAVVIAAITSCTNTSNPSVMVAAGLLAKKAVERGLRVKAHVKTSLTPGSRVVTEYLDRAGLSHALGQLGFHTVGFGCATCIGNSGPLPDAVARAVTEGNLVAAAVLSGNRNFEGRVNPLVKANYLASPPLVVAYAIAGTVDLDLTKEPLGCDREGRAVYLRDIWPTPDEVCQAVAGCMTPEMFVNQYRQALQSNTQWNAISVTDAQLYSWDPRSTYIQEPPFLADVTPEIPDIHPITGARALAMLGDSVTTDHISPAGSIAKDSPAGRFLIEHGVAPSDFNSYGARRGNDRVMVRGTFANIRIRNQLAPGTEGGWTSHLPDGSVMSIYDAAMKYRDELVPLIVLAGAEYGTGSSRDWAAKGTYLLGVRAVIAASYERIHRSNLVGMGVLPLEFVAGQTWQSLSLSGHELFDLLGLANDLQPLSQLRVRATSADGSAKEFAVNVRIDTPVELEYFRNGGILQTVLRRLLKEAR
ncbi:MAG: aconitate hydratase AcnA [Planctomycetes bacterium]|nr:aconitate hydratase AcnA [Planctomycetota bacterium]